MPFNSLQYYLFLPGVYLAFLCAGERLRWPLLLVASLGFYAALGAPLLLAALVTVIAVSFVAALAIAARPEGKKRSLVFWAAVSTNLAVLIAFKYLPAWRGTTPWISIGVSYFVFQAVSYLADVHLELLQPERHLGHFALSLAFFPKLLQGPIERGGDLLPQLKRPYRFSYDDARGGIVLFAVGLFKKVAIADRLGLYVDAAYVSPQNHSGGTLLLATYAYAFQLYFDFAGYTDMARGAARLFGIDLTLNFRSPYLATSVTDFWRRWHISFSRWILDYIFKPLQLRWRHLGKAGVAAALAVTFLASGLWHGATWGFVAWGALHALYMAAAIGWRPTQKKLHAVLAGVHPRLLLSWQRFATFHLVCLAWVFFRAPTLQAGLRILERAARPGRPLLTIGAFSDLQLASLAGAIVVNAACGHLLLDGGSGGTIPGWPLRWALYLLVGFGCYYLDVGGGNFIYFGF